MTQPLKMYKECGTCGGDGYVEVKQGDKIVEVECPACEGYEYIECGRVDGADELKQIQEDLNLIKKALEI